MSSITVRQTARSEGHDVVLELWNRAGKLVGTRRYKDLGRYVQAIRAMKGGNLLLLAIPEEAHLEFEAS